MARFSYYAGNIIFGQVGGTGDYGPANQASFGVDYYFPNYGGRYGAVIDGATLNFMALDFTGDDNVRESVAAFVFDGVGGGYIHAIARNDDNSAMSITDGITAITAAAVPESSSLALLALGSVGLAARRRRKAA